jgi:hypothetical protein
LSLKLFFFRKSSLVTINIANTFGFLHCVTLN